MPSALARNLGHGRVIGHILQRLLDCVQLQELVIADAGFDTGKCSVDGRWVNLAQMLKSTAKLKCVGDTFENTCEFLEGWIFVKL